MSCQHYHHHESPKQAKRQNKESLLITWNVTWELQTAVVGAVDVIMSRQSRQREIRRITSNNNNMECDMEIADCCCRGSKCYHESPKKAKGRFEESHLITIWNATWELQTAVVRTK